MDRQPSGTGMGTRRILDHTVVRWPLQAGQKSDLLSLLSAPVEGLVQNWVGLGLAFPGVLSPAEIGWRVSLWWASAHSIFLRGGSRLLVPCGLYAGDLGWVLGGQGFNWGRWPWAGPWGFCSRTPLVLTWVGPVALRSVSQCLLCVVGLLGSLVACVKMFRLLGAGDVVFSLPCQLPKTSNDQLTRAHTIELLVV